MSSETNSKNPNQQPKRRRNGLIQKVGRSVVAHPYKAGAIGVGVLSGASLIAQGVGGIAGPIIEQAEAQASSQAEQAQLEHIDALALADSDPSAVKAVIQVTEDSTLYDLSFQEAARNIVGFSENDYNVTTLDRSTKAQGPYSVGDTFTIEAVDANDDGVDDLIVRRADPANIPILTSQPEQNTVPSPTNGNGDSSHYETLYYDGMGNWVKDISEVKSSSSDGPITKQVLVYDNNGPDQPVPPPQQPTTPHN